MKKTLQITKFYNLLLVVFLVVWFGISQSDAQTILLDPIGAGSFESSTNTFAANGWSDATGTATRKWRTGTAAGAALGTKSAYVGSTTTFNGSAVAYVGHFYRDISIPAGAKNVLLTYSYRQTVIDGGYDYFYIFTTTTANTPVLGALPGAGYTQQFVNTSTLYSSWTAMTPIDLTAFAGTTVRLVFTFKSDGVSPVATAAVDRIGITYCTVPTTVASGLTASVVDYQTLSLGFTRGNGGGGVLVVCRPTASPAVAPTLASTSYTASLTYGAGTQVGGAGTNNYVVYNSATAGTGQAVAPFNVGPLISGTDYTFDVYEYNTTACYTSAVSVSQTPAGGCTDGEIATVNTNPSYRCMSGTSTLNLSGLTPGSYTYQWQQSLDDGVSDPWVDVTTGSGGTAATYTTGVLTHTTYFRCNVTCSVTTTSLSAPVYVYTAIQASNFIWGATATTSQVFNWSDDGYTGLGTAGGDDNDGVIIVVKQGSAPTDPTTGTDYSADPANTFANNTAGYSTAAGSYVIYKGNGTSVNINGLIPSTTYYYKIYTYSSTTNCYNLTSPLNGNFTTAACNPSTDATNYSGTSDGVGSQISVSWTRGNGSRVLVLARATSAITSTGQSLYNSDYSSTANAAYGTTQIGTTGDFVIYDGTGTSVTMTNATPGITYNFKIFEYNASPNCYSITPLTGSTAANNPGVFSNNASVVQVTGNVTPNSTNQAIVYVSIPITGGIVPAATVNSITFSLNGSISSADISSAQIYYTTSTTFATTTPFGSAISSPASGTPYTVTATKALQAGNNYFWIAYNIAASPPATIGDVVDADITSFNLTTYSGGTANYTPAPTAPTGSRLIMVTYCTVTDNSSACSSGNSFATSHVTFTGTPLPSPDGISASPTWGCGIRNGIYYDESGNYASTVTQGLTYSFIIYRGTANYASYVSAWIDWNQNGSFADASENPGGNPNIAAYSTNTVTMPVPANASPGPHRLRIINTYATTGTASCNMSQGSAYDFTINVVASCTPPSTQASGLSYSAISPTGATINFTRGDGDKVLVICRQGSSPTDPVSGTGGYTADANFAGSGSSVGGGKVVYDGTGNGQGAAFSLPVTGLTNGLSYYFNIIEYNTSGICYKLIGYKYATPVIPACVQPDNQVSVVSFSNIISNTTASTLDISFTRPNPCADGGVIIVAKAGSAPTDPSAGTAYTANPVFGTTGTECGGGFIVYNSNDVAAGSSLSPLTISNLTAGVTYYFNAYEYNATNTCYKLSAAANSYRIPDCTPPGTQADWLSPTNIFSNGTSSSATLHITRGNGPTGVLVVVKEGSAPADPTQGSTYNADPAFGNNITGYFTAAGSYVLYKGNSAGTVDIPITGLTNNKTYYVKLYEIDDVCYNTTGSAYTVDIPLCDPPAMAPTGFSLGAGTSSSQTLNWNNNSNPDGSLIVVKQGSTPTDPSMTVSYNADATFGNGSSTAADSYVVYKGNGTSVNILGLLPNLTYYYKIYTYKASTDCYNLTSTLSGNFTTTDCSPATSASDFISSAITNNTMTISFSRGSGSKVLVLAHAASSVVSTNLSLFNNDYSAVADPAFGSYGAQIGSTGDYVVFDGNTAGTVNVNLTNLTPGITYNFKIFEYYTSPNCYSITPLTGSATALNPGVYSNNASVLQVTASVAPLATDQQVVYLNIPVTGGTNPAATVNSITFEISGTTTSADILSARIYYTNSATFSAATPFGSSISAPVLGTPYTVTATKALAVSSNNNFWIAFNIAGSPPATPGTDVVDAAVTSFNMTTYAGGTADYTPVPSAPVGNRPIILSYCTVNDLQGASGNACNGGNSFGIYHVTFTGAELPSPDGITSSPNWGCSAGYTLTNYDRTSYSSTLTKNKTYQFYVSREGTNYASYVAAYVDWNNNGVFTDSDENPGTAVSCGGTNCSTWSMTVPASASVGTHRLRIVDSYAGGGNMNSCQVSQGQSYDFSLSVISPIPCSGTPAASTVTPASTNGCWNSGTVLSLTGITDAPGLTYQWKYSDAVGGPYSDISGATNATYTTPVFASPSVAVSKYYVCNVTCTNSGISTLSSEGAVNVNPFYGDCYCAPILSYYNANEGITNVTLNGQSVNLNYTTTCAAGGYIWFYYGAQANPDLAAGNTYTVSVTNGSNATGTHYLSAWIDFNGDGLFDDATERLGGPSSVAASSTTPFTFTVPGAAKTGLTGMRIREVNSASTLNACSTFSTSTYVGEAEDYVVNILGAICSGTPSAGTAAVVSSSFCSGGSTPINLTGFTAAGGISFQWQSSTDGINFSNVVGGSGATTASYTTPAITNVTGSDVQYYYQCVVTCQNSSLTASSNIVTVTVKPSPATAATANGINPSYSCSGASVNLLATGLSGTTFTWSSSPAGFTSSIANPTVSPTNTTTYTVVGTLNGCTSSSSVKVSIMKVSVNPVSATINTGSNQVITATTTDNYGTITYGWTPCASLNSATSSTVTATPAGTTIYNVTAFDENGCTSIAGSTVKVNESGIPATAPNTVIAGYSYAYGYPSGWTAASSLGTPTSLVWADDAVYTNQPIGFTFNFKGTAYTTMGISSNGFIWFGSGSCSSTQYTPLSSQSGESGQVDGIASVFGSDLATFGSTTLKYVTYGTIGSRTCVIEWNSAGIDKSASSLSRTDFQIRLYEATGNIEFWYRDAGYDLTFAGENGVFKGQTGIRGSVTSDFFNRTNGCEGPWASTTAGTANTDGMSIGGGWNCAASWPATGCNFRYASTCNTPQTIITASGSTDLCPAQSVDLTASSGESYKWYLNGSEIAGATNQSLTGVNTAGRYVAVSTSGGCGFPSIITNVTNNITVTPSITISSNPVKLCSATSATFTATPFNTGCVPVYQWKLNGTNVTNVAANSTVYTNNALNPGDQVEVVMTSSALCASPSNAISNSITNTPIPTDVTAVPVNNPVCEQTMFTLNGSGTNVTSWSWTGPNGFTSSNQNPSIANMLPAYAGIYQLTVYNSGCAAAVVNTAPVVVNTLSKTPTAISMSPSNSVCFNQTVTLGQTGGSLGTGAQWVWYADNGAGSKAIMGPGNPNYTITVTATNDYYVRAEGGVCDFGNIGDYNVPVAQNNVVYLTNTTTINQNPISHTETVNSAGSFYCDVYMSATNQSWQWQSSSDLVNWSAPLISAPYSSSIVSAQTVPPDPLLANLYTITLNINPVTNGLNNLYYRCIVSGDCGSATSTPAQLTVGACTGVSLKNPTSQNVCLGNGVLFSITPVTGDLTGATYQWYKGTSTIPSATNDQYFIATVTGSDNGAYKCVVTNCGGSIKVTSSAATLTVNSLPATPTASKNPSAVCDHGSFTLTATAGAGANEIYQWYDAPTLYNYVGSGPSYTTGVVSTNTDFYVAVYNTVTLCYSAYTNIKALVNTYPTDPITNLNVSRCGPGQLTLSAIGAGAGEGYHWYTVPTGGSPYTGSSYTVTVASSTSFYLTKYNTTSLCESYPRIEVFATVNPLPTADISPSGTSAICQGDNQILHVNTDVGTIFAWKKNGANAPGVNSAINYSAFQAGNYTVVVTSPLSCTSTSSIVAITTNALPTNPVLASNGESCGPGSVTISVVNDAGPDEVYNWYADNFSGSPIQSDASPLFNTPYLNATTSYWVSKHNNLTHCDSPDRIQVYGLIYTRPDLYITKAVFGCSSEPMDITKPNLVFDNNNTIGTYSYWKDVNCTIPVANPAAITDEGSYYIKKTTTLTNCYDVQTIYVQFFPLPNTYSVTNITSCSPISIILNGSEIDVDYKLLYDNTFVLATKSGTGSSIDFGVQNQTGKYSVAGIRKTTGCTVNMTGATIITTPPTISMQPVDRSIRENGTVTFSIASVGSVWSYQWLQNNIPVSNITGTPGYSGANTNTLTISNAQLSMDQNKYKCVVSSPCGIFLTSSVATLTVTKDGTPGLWTGVTSSDWNTGSNWDTGVPPIASTDVYIPGNTPYDPDIYALQSGVCHDIIVAPTGSLSVHGTLSAGGNMTIKSTLAGTGAFLQSSVASISVANIKVERYLQTAGYHYLSSPLNSVNVNAITNFNPTNLVAPGVEKWYNPDLTWSAGTLSNIYKVDEAHTHELALQDKNVWKFMQTGETLEKMRGYAFNLSQGNIVLSVTRPGTDINKGNITFNVTKTAASTDVQHNVNINDCGCVKFPDPLCNGSSADLALIPRGTASLGWNLVGNPYTAPIDWDQVAIDNNLPYKTIAFFKPTSQYAGIYGYYNYVIGHSGAFYPSNYIPVMQAFYIQQAVVGTLALTFKNDYCSVDKTALTVGAYKKIDKKFPDPMLRLSVYQSDNKLAKDEALIIFRSDNVTNDNLSLDATKFMNTDASVSNIYSLANDKAFAIKEFPEITDNLIIPLGFNAAASGNYTVDASDLKNFSADYNIFLVDSKLSIAQDIRNKPLYDFNFDGQMDNSRFYLKFALNGQSSLELCKIYSSDNNLFINYSNPSKELAVLSICNTQGQTIRPDVELHNGKYNTKLNVAAGVYFVKVITSTKVYLQKVFIK